MIPQMKWKGRRKIIENVINAGQFAYVFSPFTFANPGPELDSTGSMILSEVEALQSAQDHIMF